jgi:hypothetical protein
LKQEEVTGMNYYVLEVRGPVAAFGQYLCWATGCCSVHTTDVPEAAIKFGGKGSATRFAALIKPADVVAVPVVAP